MIFQWGEGSGAVLFRVADLVQMDRDAVWSEDGTDLIGVDLTLGLIMTAAPGGNPALDSVVGLSPDTTAHLDGSDATARKLGTNPRGENPGASVGFFAPVFETAGAAPFPVRAVSERSGPETDAEVRNWLWRPRQKMILFAHDRQTGARIRWVESPRPGMPTDLANGPYPLSVDVLQASGEPNSIAYRFVVQTRLSPCPTGADTLVLSHRWQMTHAHDDDHYLTRVIEGNVTFNGAVLRRLKMQPDWIRRQFVHPIPLGFKRKPPTVAQSSDGLTIRYRVEDVDPTIMFDSGDSGCTNIQIIEKVSFQNPTTWNGDPGRGRDD